MHYNIKHTFAIPIAIFCALSLSSCATPHKIAPAPISGLATITETPLLGSSMMREPAYHLVAPGETLWRISKMYDVNVEELIKVNKIKDVKDIDIGSRLYIPNAAPIKNVVTLYPSKKWKYIIVHHSATESGNSIEFNNAHLKRGWKGIGYHFVIDNGTRGKAPGQIETSPRWINQQDGAHCKAAGMNEKGIGICLVGNFSKDEVSDRQLSSLVYLVNKLKKFYNIPSNHILGHGQVPGAQTECPGTKFPWNKFRKQIQP